MSLYSAPLPDFDPEDVPTDPEERSRWQISGPRSAEWAMRKLARTRRLLADVDEQKTEWTHQLATWYREATAGLTSDAEWAEGLLRDWALRARRDDPESKTFPLPSGTVATSERPARVEVVHAGQLASSLASVGAVDVYDEVVSVVVKVDGTGLNRHARVGSMWLIGLDCQCEVERWLPDGAGFGEPRPGWEVAWDDEDHEPRHSTLDRTIRIALVDRVRENVVMVPTPKGWRPIEGARAIPAKVTTSVRLR